MRDPILSIGVAAMTLLALGACTTTSSNVRVDKAEVDLAKCQTFDWFAGEKGATSLTDQRVRAAALAELERKGYTLATDTPDCRVTYALSSYERPEAKPRVGAGVGGGSGGIGGGIGISLPVGRRDSHAGTLTVDVIDANKKAQIWSGSLDASFDAAELTQEEAQELIAKILDEFPDRAASAK
jgi:hypothetical protein